MYKFFFSVCPAGPCIGALAAIPFHLFFRSDFDTLPSKIQDPVDLRAAESFISDDQRRGTAAVSPEDTGNNNRARVVVQGVQVQGENVEVENERKSGLLLPV